MYGVIGDERGLPCVFYVGLGRVTVVLQLPGRANGNIKIARFRNEDNYSRFHRI